MKQSLYLPVAATLAIACVSWMLLLPHILNASALSMSPNTGVYTVGATFSVNVVLNSQGKAINAADGTLSFNPRELQVVSVSRAASIFNLWTAEPTFSNANGTITFSGGTPTGFTGASGNVMTVTFRTITAGSPRVTLSNASVLAADGMGTNVLTSMGGGSYTVSAQSTTPTPEVVIEYVAPANTPSAPVVQSSTHPDPTSWSTSTTAVLRWILPPGVTAVRTLLDTRPTSIPTRVYDNPINTITLEDLPDGESYFHVQFQNADGWGRVTHYRLAVDTKAPQGLQMSLPNDADLTSPDQFLVVLTATTTGAPIILYKVQINGQTPIEIEKPTDDIIQLPKLSPGYQTVVVEAINAAGLSTLASLSFTIEAFEAPMLENIPEQILTTSIPVFQGRTRPGAVITVELSRIGTQARIMTVIANEQGYFTAVFDSTLERGAYEISVSAVDSHGALSEKSPTYRFVVEEPGYVLIGSMLINIASTAVTLIALLVAATLSLWYLVFAIRRLRSRVAVETHDIESAVETQFTSLVNELRTKTNDLSKRRKNGTLTAAEKNLIENIENSLTESKTKLLKEINDVLQIVEK